MTLNPPWEWRRDDEHKKKGLHPKCTAMAVVLANRPLGMTMPAPPGLQPHAVASMSVSLELQGTVRRLDGALKGTKSEPK